MEYFPPRDAQSMPGLRLALTRDAPAPYSMSAKAILQLRQVPYVAVEQVGGGQNEDLVTWTGHRNAPVAVYEDEAPRAGWLEILNLAERLGSGASLVPEDIDQRMLMVGLTNELIGENGWVWNMRLIMLGLGGPERAADAARQNPMYAQYGYSEQTRAAALERARGIMSRFAAHAEHQRGQDSRYLIGHRLSALDVYWVFFSQIAKTLPEEQCAMPRGLRKAYEASGEALGGCDAALIEQRDWILRNHLTLPLEF
jgi:glutathione S-transferase